MLTQQDIYAAGSENRPPVLNKDNYVPWSSCLLHYVKSKPNGKLIYNSIMNGPYVRRMIPEPGDQDCKIPVAKTFHEQTDEEITKKEVKQIEADDQAIQTILMGLTEDIYAAVDSCETAQEIWLRVQQMMKGSDIRIQEKNAKLFNEWERFTSTDGELIKSYYHRFSKLMNDFKRNKHFPEKIASNLKFLNNLQPEWSRHVTIVHQTKDLHTSDYIQLFDFLKYNQKEVNELRAKRLARTHDPLALMANSNNPYNYPVFHQDQPSPVTYMQQPPPNKNYNPQPSFNQNYMQQPMINHDDISDPTIAMNMELVLISKIALSGMNLGQDRQMHMVGGNGGNQFRQYTGQNKLEWAYCCSGIVNPNANQNENGNVVTTRAEGNGNGSNGNQIRCYNYRGMGHLARNCTVRPKRRDAAYLQTQLLISQNEEARIQLQAEEFDLMAAAGDLDEIEKMDQLSVEQSEGTIDQHHATVEEKHAYFESLYTNLDIEVEKVNKVKCKYVTRNTGKGRENEEYTDSYEALRHNPYDSVTLLWFRWISFDYRVTLGFGSIAGGLDHVNPIIRLPIEHGINKGTRVDMGDDVDISALTIEHYMALIQDNNRPGIVKPKIGDDIEFEINSKFMRELRHKIFAGTNDEDAHKHVRRVLEIIDLLHFPSITHDAVMLRVFPITLKGRALRWKKGLPAGVINTWDLLEKEFI
ncbi:retrovirus-related pol polyprotein from transposon TNT 1-94 [Tanacetum coccineum]